MGEASLRLEFKEDGIYLVSLAEGMPDLSDVVDLLKQKGVENYDGDAIVAFLKEKQQEPFKIAERDPANERDAVVEVQINADGMSADLRISPPTGDKPWPTVDFLQKSLAEKGVVFGVDTHALGRIVQERIINEWVHVASGQLPQDGKDAQIDFSVQFGESKPKVTEDGGKVDYRNMNTITIVLKNQLLATKTVPTEGHSGMTVRGIPVAAKLGRDYSLPVGKGTYIAEDGLSLLASTDGHLTLSQGKLNVIPVFTVDGDLDYSVGNINFIGTVDIKGSVREGFEVVSSGDIQIRGVVEGARLSSKGNIALSGGVRGMGKARIEAVGNIEAAFVDQCLVASNGTVQIKNAILHSDVSANQSVVVLGGAKSQIAGGRIQAGVEVLCQTLGSEMGTKTEVIVGVLPEYNERKKELQTLITALKDKADKVEANLSFLKKLESAGEIDDGKRELLISLTKNKFQIQAQLIKHEDELQSIEARIETSRSKGRVRVKGVCYPGVSVTIRGVTYIVREEQRFAAFIYEAGEVRVKPFDF
ncbi:MULTISPECIES: DUF342 domain-containing protein [Aminobacterium]|jgi:hypothetical protein|uniref:DUF342 domain-containing protein n=1 Tax=Aminobacterium TaxID=81466 RepID=UPI00258066CB|nr:MULTISPECIES: FapA family protein [unclassified Aminobacterium]